MKLLEKFYCCKNFVFLLFVVLCEVCLKPTTQHNSTWHLICQLDRKLLCLLLSQIRPQHWQRSEFPTNLNVSKAQLTGKGFPLLTYAYCSILEILAYSTLSIYTFLYQQSVHSP